MRKNDTVAFIFSARFECHVYEYGFRGDDYEEIFFPGFGQFERHDQSECDKGNDDEIGQHLGSESGLFEPDDIGGLRAFRCLHGILLLTNDGQR